MSSTKPIIVVVPGSAHTPSHWALLIAVLEKAGYPTFTATLSSVAPSAPVTLSEEVDFVRNRMILPMLDQRGLDVVLLTHSSSSVPGSAAAKGLSKMEREALGKKTSVIGQIMVAAMLGREGLSVMDIMGGKLPPHIKLDSEAQLLVAPDPIPALYPDVPAPLAQAAAGAIQAHSNAAFTTPSPPQSWPDQGFENRRAFVYTTNEAVVPSAGQTAKVAQSGVKWIERSLQGGHSPQLAQPEALGALVVEFAEHFVAVGA